MSSSSSSGKNLSREMRRQLAQMHQHLTASQGFGFHIDNTIGAAPQPNIPWMDDRVDFWDHRRLCQMLKLTES
jgi:fructosamine-3-kinase